MKKALAILLTIALLLSFGLFALGSGSEDTDTPAQNDTANQAEDPAVEDPTETPTAEPTETFAFEEILVVDNEQCTVKITGIDEKNLWGYTLKVFLENKSTEKTFMFSVVSASVNGVDSDPLFAQEVAPGKKSNESISFTDSSLDSNDIGDFTDILLNFRVYDSNDWMADNIAETSVHVYPYGEENATKYVREPQATDTILVDNEHATVLITDYDPDNLWGYTANIYIVNKTDKTIMVSIDEASVNGYMIDPFFATSVIPGASKFSSISWSTSEFEENGITEVESIELILKVYDENDWTANDFVYERITINP